MKQSVIIDNIKSRLGIETLNPMQHEVMNSGARDMLLLSPTGSGKTVAFAIVAEVSIVRLRLGIVRTIRRISS